MPAERDPLLDAILCDECLREFVPKRPGQKTCETPSCAGGIGARTRDYRKPKAARGGEPEARRRGARMRALTVWQPWAHFLALGIKRVENREWAPPKDLMGQWIAIHAGKRYDHAGAESIRTELGIDVPVPGSLAQSAIVAVGVLDRIATCEDDSFAWDDPWFTGAFGWYLRDVVKIDAVTCKGAQKLWVVPPRILAQVRANFRVARAAGTPEKAAP